MREGDQLELWTARELGLHRVPWEGQSPRVLTACYKRFIFKARAAKSMSEFVNPDQGDLWLPMKNAPRVVSRGAPSLLPLPKRW